MSIRWHKRNHGHRAWRVLGALLLLLAFSTTVEDVRAQSTNLAYGSSASGRIAPETPLGIYDFSGSAGDLVTLRVLSLTSDLNPTLLLLAPDQSPLFANDDYPLGDISTDSFISIYLPQTGVYAALVGSMDGTSGDYVLQLNGRPPLTHTDTLTQDAPVLVDIPAGAPKQYFVFDALSCPTTLTITNQSAGTPFSFPYVVNLRGPDGALVGETRGGRALQDRITVPANSGRYEVEVYGADALTGGTITLVITCADRQPTCVTPILGVVVPPTPTPTPTPPAGQMLLIQSGGALNAPRTDVGGVILPNAPLINYTFDGAAGELVTLQAISLTLSLDPTLQLLSPALAPIAANNDDPFGFTSGDAALSFVLTESGTHSVLVGAEDGTTGEFLLRFQKRAVQTGTVLAFGQPVTVQVPPPSPESSPPNVPQYFSFAAEDCPTTLTITNLSGGNPYTFPFTLKLRDQRGEIVARLAGGRALEDRVTVAPNSGVYEIEIYTGDRSASGQIQLLVTCGESAPSCGDWDDNPPFTPRQPTPVFTPTPTGTATHTPTLPPCPPNVALALGDTTTKRQAPYRQEIVTPVTTPGGPPDFEIIEVEPLESSTPNLTATDFWNNINTLIPLLTQTPEVWPTLSPPAQTLVSYLTGTPERLPTVTTDVVPTATPTATSTPCATWTPTPTRPPITRQQPTRTPTPTATVPFCGDGICQPGVDNCDCRIDCANDPTWLAQCFPTPTPFCGDGICQIGVDNCECRIDCGNDPTWLAQCFPTPAPFCGDGICQIGVDNCDCRIDCGNDPTWLAQCFPTPAPFCGDGICQPENGETGVICDPNIVTACIPTCACSQDCGTQCR